MSAEPSLALSRRSDVDAKKSADRRPEFAANCGDVSIDFGVPNIAADGRAGKFGDDADATISGGVGRNVSEPRRVGVDVATAPAAGLATKA